MASFSWKRPGVVAAALYVAVCIVLAIGAVLENDPVAFAPLVLITMPFSLLASKIFAWAGIAATPISGFAIIAIAAALNALVIHAVVRWIARAVSGGRRR